MSAEEKFRKSLCEICLRSKTGNKECLLDVFKIATDDVSGGFQKTPAPDRRDSACPLYHRSNKIGSQAVLK